MTNSNFSERGKIIELERKLQKANDVLFQITVTVVSVKDDKEAMSIIAKTCNVLGHDWDYNQKEARKEIKDLARAINENRDFNSGAHQ